MKTICIESDKCIKEGEGFYVFSSTVQPGDAVEIRRYYGELIGNPIAEGACVEYVEPLAERSENNRRAWKQYRKIVVSKIR